MRIAVFQGPQDGGDVARNLERLDRSRPRRLRAAPGC